MSIREPAQNMVCVTTMHTGEGIIRKGDVLPSTHAAVKRNRHLFLPATAGPTLDPEAMREAERGLWARMTASDS